MNSSPWNRIAIGRMQAIRTVATTIALLSTIGLVGGGSAASLPASVAQAPSGANATIALACGDTITTGVTLTADLTCPGTIFTIGANNLVIDLNGHTVAGAGSGAVVVGTNRSNVTIRNGAIRTAGVSLRSVANAVIDSVSFTNASVYAGTSNDMRIVGSSFAATGVQVSGSARAAVSRSSFTGGQLSVAGIGTARSEAASVSETSFTDTRVYFAADANRPSVSDSTFLRSPVELSQSDHLDVRDSVFVGAGIRLSYTSRNAVVSGSLFTGAPVAVEINSQSSGARLERNSFHPNNVGVMVSGPRLDLMAGTTVAHNRFDMNGTAGVLITSAGNGNAHTSLAMRDNRLSLNGLSPDGRTGSTGQLVNDGVHLDVPAAANITLAGNTTIANGDHGIQVAPGTVYDGGGNSSTGDPAGCAGVVCA